MLTRLEVDGFKNLINFSVDFGPFTCIAGPNGVGKSNVFDAIRFLSLLCDHTLMEAAQKVRGSETETSDARDLFRTGERDRTDSFHIAAEMIVEPNVHDDFGRPAEASSTYLRYEVGIAYEGLAQGGPARLVLQSETLKHIKEGEASSRLRFPHSARKFRGTVVKNRRKSQSGFISTEEAADGQTAIVVHQDGGSRGQAVQRASAATAPRTIVGTSNTSNTPTILAARREMQRWRLLALEPTAMRNPDKFFVLPSVLSSGSHLPATVYHLATEVARSGRDPQTVYSSIAARLSRLVSVNDLRVDVDEVRQLLTLELREHSGTWLPAASLSDGTLRFLTLAVLVSDPAARGLICLEEPENGIHPAKMPDMVDLLHDLAVDPSEIPDDVNPFRQVVVATHSPVFVQLQRKDDLLFAIEARVRGANGEALQTLRCRPLPDTWRARQGEPTVGLGTNLAYLSTPPGAQIELPQAAKMGCDRAGSGDRSLAAS